MKTSRIIALAACTAIATTILFLPFGFSIGTNETPADHFVDVDKKVADPKPAERKLTHAQEVWIHALEWCESRGDPEAINEIDRDGTSSYGPWQFKPATLWHFGKIYNVPATKDLTIHDIDETFVMDYERQRATIEEMVLHASEIKWSYQFPDCVARLGPPPEPPVCEENCPLIEPDIYNAESEDTHKETPPDGTGL